jgi:hypothetical protein
MTSLESSSEQDSDSEIEEDRVDEPLPKHRRSKRNISAY